MKFCPQLSTAKQVEIPAGCQVGERARMLKPGYAKMNQDLVIVYKLNPGFINHNYNKPRFHVASEPTHRMALTLGFLIVILMTLMQHDTSF